MRRAAPFVLAVAVVAIVVIGLIQASGGPSKDTLGRFDIDAALTRLQGAPAPLAALHAQHDQLLGGGVKALKARLADLRGHPVVINKWGSWCPACRQEFDIFQHAGADYGKRVAFLGIDTVDPAGDAREFLADNPLTYPSFRDPHGALSDAVGAPGGAPITVFLDARGKMAFIHSGEYQTYAALKADMKRYLRA